MASFCRRDQRYLLGQVPLRQALALVNQDGVRILHPHLHRGLNGVVAAAQVVVHSILVHRLLAAVGHLPALPADVKLHHVAVLGDFDAVVIGPLVKFKVLRRCPGRDCRGKTRQCAPAAPCSACSATPARPAPAPWRSAPRAPAAHSSLPRRRSASASHAAPSAASTAKTIVADFPILIVSSLSQPAKPSMPSDCLSAACLIPPAPRRRSRSTLRR